MSLSPYQNLEDEELLQSLRGAVVYYDEPLEPVALNDWEALH